jgi:Zn-dependent oligopeptidase
MASSSAVVATNPLLEQQALPKFASIQPSDLTPAVSDLLEKMEADFQKLEEELRKV